MNEGNEMKNELKLSEQQIQKLENAKNAPESELISLNELNMSILKKLSKKDEVSLSSEEKTELTKRVIDYSNSAKESINWKDLKKEITQKLKI